mgnify:CR=1 FL=1|jgi:hypothetical protein
MYRQVDLTERTISNVFDELVKVQTRWRELLVFSSILFDIFDDFLPILIDALVDLTAQVWVHVRLNLVD